VVKKYFVYSDKKMPGHKAGQQERNRIGVADSYGSQKGRERAYAGLQRIYKKALHAIAIKHF
jgi:hypothetical protein